MLDDIQQAADSLPPPSAGPSAIARPPRGSVAEDNASMSDDVPTAVDSPPPPSGASAIAPPPHGSVAAGRLTDARGSHVATSIKLAARQAVSPQLVIKQKGAAGQKIVLRVQDAPQLT